MSGNTACRGTRACWPHRTDGLVGNASYGPLRECQRLRHQACSPIGCPPPRGAHRSGDCRGAGVLRRASGPCGRRTRGDGLARGDPATSRSRSPRGGGVLSKPDKHHPALFAPRSSLSSSNGSWVVHRRVDPHVSTSACGALRTIHEQPPLVCSHRWSTYPSPSQLL